MKRCFVLVPCIVGVLAGDAHAFVKYVPLTIDMPEVDVPMHTSKRTKIDMPEIINHWDAGNRHDYNVTRNSTKKSLGIELLQRRAPPSNSNFESANWSVSLSLRPVDTHGEAASAVIFYVPTTQPVTRVPARESPDTNQDSDSTQASDYLARTIVEKDIRPPVTRRWWHDTYRLQAKIGPVCYGPDYLSFRFEIRNIGELYRFLNVEVHDNEGRVREIEYSLPGMTGDRAIEFAPGDTLIGAIKVPNAEGLREGWTLYLHTPIGVAPASFEWDDEDERGTLEKRLLLSMRASGGLANLDDGIGIDKAIWTPANALGLLVLYGMWENVSIEGTLDLGRTSEAAFDDAVWDTMTGSLAVQETSGRILAGVVFHGGTRWIPHARVVAGARFSRRTTSMASRSETEVRAGMVLGIGGGLNVALTKRIMAGTSFTFVAPFGGNDSSLTAEAGLHLGAIWDLAARWR